jgi:hypothetical protein
MMKWVQRIWLFILGLASGWCATRGVIGTISGDVGAGGAMLLAGAALFGVGVWVTYSFDSNSSRQS